MKREKEEEEEEERKSKKFDELHPSHEFSSNICE